MKSTPKDSETNIPPPKTTVQYPWLDPIWVSHAKPTVAISVPIVHQPARCPTEGAAGELPWAPTMMITPIGAKANPARRAL